MPSTPTTKSQVQAYRFVLRRMESALVRKDAVMLHEPMRVHQRSTTIGVIVAAVGVIGFLVFGVIKQSPSLPDNGIVISQQSGAVYVVTSNAAGKQLIPMTNLTSARLLLMAQGGSAGSAAPSVVDEAQMRGTPRGRLTGIFGAPDFLPTSKDELVSGAWAVCDEPNVHSDQVDQSKAKPITTVLGGVANLGQELRDNQALLVQAVPTNDTYLLYRTPQGAVRAKVDLTNGGVRTTYKLPDPSTPSTSIRRASLGLINSIPLVSPIGKPQIAGSGDVPGLPGTKVGSVFKVSRANGDVLYVGLKDGIKQVQPVVADLIASTSGLSSTFPTLGLDKIVNVAQLDSVPALDDLPTATPELVDTGKAPVACFSWNGKDSQEQTTLTISSKTPNGTQGVALNNAGADFAFLPPGHAAVVRSATSKQDFGLGPIFLVSDRGVKFGVPDVDTAKGLGLGEQFDPAPDAILKLLPTGPALDKGQVQRSFDAVSLDDSMGVMPSRTTQKANG